MSLHTLRCTAEDFHRDASSLDWLSNELETLPPSHHLKSLILNPPQHSNPFRNVLPWSRLDEAIHTTRRFQLTVNLMNTADQRHSVLSAFERSTQAGLLSIQIWNPQREDEEL